MVIAAMKLRLLLVERKVMTNLDSILKSIDITVPTKVRLVKDMFFPSSHVWMWELNYKESWVPRNCCFWTVVLEKTLESLLDSKEMQPVHSKGNQSWILIGRTDAEAETLILSPHDVKNWLICKDPDAGKDWRWEEKGTTEGEMVGWHHRLNGHEFEQTLGVGDGQRGLACCDSWGHKESDTTEWLNWTELNFYVCNAYSSFITYKLKFSELLPVSETSYACGFTTNFISTLFLFHTVVYCFEHDHVFLISCY